MKQRDNIPVDKKEELKDIAPRLSALNSTNPFVVPNNYFDSLSSNVLNNVKRQNALIESLREQEIPVATNPFETPPGYFETLPDVVIQRISSEPKVIGLPSTRWKEWLSVAAAVAALVMVALPLLKPNEIQTNASDVVTNESLQQVSNDELYGYLSEEVNVWPAEEVAAGLSEAKLDTLENELVAIQTTDYEDAWMDLSQLDIESLDIESM